MAVCLDPDLADDMGLVAVGGDLSPRQLLDAYKSGVFPWYNEELPICWWSPDPRAIFELDGIHVPRRLARTIRQGQFRCTINQAFSRVIRRCADRGEGTWLTGEMIDAYERMHRLGYAHSFEAWSGGELAGGIYGIAIGGFFAGESMFSQVRDASKVALVRLVEHLRERGFELFDTQFLNDHTHRLGAIEIPRTEYLRRLKSALACKVRFV